ncbi:restriction endonuclease type II-like protein [Rhizophagus clarus]|uniref:Restriction endonuclease type II-like protein n=1 Tax=Rhizophagus clarus TaxID=94130 RepID=A0A8H3MD65_9GLOM|nr:restriction endonuclease type II-like protein [Rhizophagus clarus]
MSSHIFISGSSIKQLELVANANPSFFRVNLIDSVLDIMLVTYSTGMWNTLTDAQQNETYPPVTPNFIVESRSQSDSEGWFIDRYQNPPEVRIYTLNANGQILMQTLSNPPWITSTVLRGFVMSTRGIF